MWKPPNVPLPLRACATAQHAATQQAHAGAQRGAQRDGEPGLCEANIMWILATVSSWGTSPQFWLVSMVGLYG